MTCARNSVLTKVIVLVGAGRLQEWQQLDFGEFNVLAIDPAFKLPSWIKVNVQTYSTDMSFRDNMRRMSTVRRVLMVARMGFDTFMNHDNNWDMASTASLYNIPFVFSFSLQHCVPYANILVSAGV